MLPFTLAIAGAGTFRFVCPPSLDGARFESFTGPVASLNTVSDSNGALVVVPLPAVLVAGTVYALSRVDISTDLTLISGSQPGGESGGGGGLDAQAVLDTVWANLAVDLPLGIRVSGNTRTLTLDLSGVSPVLPVAPSRLQSLATPAGAALYSGGGLAGGSYTSISAAWSVPDGTGPTEVAGLDLEVDPAAQGQLSNVLAVLSAQPPVALGLPQQQLNLYYVGEYASGGQTFARFRPVQRNAGEDTRSISVAGGWTIAFNALVTAGNFPVAQRVQDSYGPQWPVLSRSIQLADGSTDLLRASLRLVGGGPATVTRGTRFDPAFFPVFPALPPAGQALGGVFVVDDAGRLRLVYRDASGIDHDFLGGGASGGGSTGYIPEPPNSADWSFLDTFDRETLGSDWIVFESGDLVNSRNARIVDGLLQISDPGTAGKMGSYRLVLAGNDWHGGDFEIQVDVVAPAVPDEQAGTVGAMTRAVFGLGPVRVEISSRVQALAGGGVGPVNTAALYTPGLGGMTASLTSSQAIGGLSGRWSLRYSGGHAVLRQDGAVVLDVDVYDGLSYRYGTRGAQAYLSGVTVAHASPVRYKNFAVRGTDAAIPAAVAGYTQVANFDDLAIGDHWTVQHTQEDSGNTGGFIDSIFDVEVVRGSLLVERGLPLDTSGFSGLILDRQVILRPKDLVAPGRNGRLVFEGYIRASDGRMNYSVVMPTMELVFTSDGRVAYATGNGKIQTLLGTVPLEGFGRVEIQADAAQVQVWVNGSLELTADRPGPSAFPQYAIGVPYVLIGGWKYNEGAISAFAWTPA